LLDNLKKEGKRWLRALRSGDAEARARLLRGYAKAPAEPSLRDVQHALACEYGFTGWRELKQAVAARDALLEAQRSPDEHSSSGAPAELVARFLEYACPDHHVRGRPAHRIARHAAMRLLEQHPEIARANFYTAVVCGDVDGVARGLRDDPQLAKWKSPAAGPDRSGAGGAMDFLHDLGPKNWEPLLYLCFTRLPLERANANALETARLLLDAGADPNCHFMAGSSRYTPLSGAIGEGEEDRPPHPARGALVRLLLERGAEPYDAQVIYNLHFHGDVLWWLRLMHEFSLARGRAADWRDPEWHMLAMGPYGSGALWHLGLAVQHNDVELAHWCLEHGATPNPAAVRDARQTQQSIYELAIRAGRVEIAELLARYGAPRVAVELSLEDQFVAACLRLDHNEGRRLAAERPEFLRSPNAMFAAAKQDRADVVDFLLALGTPIEVEDEKKQRPLHVAAYAGAVNVAQLLIERGAEIDPVEQNWNNTPLDFAVYADHPRLAELLSRYSRDIGNLAFLGKIDRLRDLLAADPHLAKLNWGATALFWLPDDEAAALGIVELFLAHGADAAFRGKQDGMAAADVARRRGLVAAAERLDAAAKASGGADDASRFRAACERLAADVVSAYSGDAPALARVNQHYGRGLTHDDLAAEIWRTVYEVQQRSSRGEPNELKLAEAQALIAHEAGYSNWKALTGGSDSGVGSVAAAPPFAIDERAGKITPRRRLSASEWDELIAVMRERRLTALDAKGLMTDDVIARVAALEPVTALTLGGSRELTDDGLLHLARMPQLEELNLNEYPGGRLTDRGLAVLPQLPKLRVFEMAWQSGITDVGVENLRACEQLERVDLMGTATGDGAIRALAGKPRLRQFQSGSLVTDASLSSLHEFPRFKRWHGGEARFSLMSPERGPTHLLLDGPITDAGLAGLSSLAGLFALTLFRHTPAVTPAGLAPLAKFANLRFVNVDGRLCDDTAMRHIAAIPRLRMLIAQSAIATDDGFAALSHSQTLEYLWTREAPNLTGRGFAALSRIPALRGLGVSCKNVEDAALALLPNFPALTELMPMDVRDDGFRHVGACRRLERLWCMYCRDTTDAATEHIARLPRLRFYYAGKTQITDRSLEILSGITSLEKVEFCETSGISDAGLVFLARLPRLREVEISGCPNVTLPGTQVFPAGVRVSYSLGG
jgi:ankyrin repeat protein